MIARNLIVYALFVGYFVLLQMIYYAVLLTLVYGGVFRLSDVIGGIELRTLIIAGSLLLMIVTYLTMHHVYRLFRLLPRR